MARAIMIILDGLGVGGAPDAEVYGDTGSDTLANMAAAVGGLNVPNLASLGLGNIHTIAGVQPVAQPRAGFGRLQELSAGKDSTTGHWELLGQVTEHPYPTYPDGFPAVVLDEFTRLTGFGVLGNKAASGTTIIEELGDEHLATGKLIVYTSADSVFQIAAHDQVCDLDRLYSVCEIARKMLVPPHEVSRVIARPFTGASGAFTRTAYRRDYSVKPSKDLLLPRLKDRSVQVLSIGKIYDLYAGLGIDESTPSKSNAEGMAELERIYAETAEQDTLILLNLVDFDMLWGHRNDPEGMKKGLEEFDPWLGGFLTGLQDGDLLLMTADHGNDPTTPSTDHSREQVPILAYLAGNTGGVDLGTREGFLDVGATLAEYFDMAGAVRGKSFLRQLTEGSNNVDDGIKELITAACEVRRQSYSPYSKFRVGAALRGKSGRIYLGTNVENASFGLSICAERAAICQAVTSGEREFAAIAICADGHEPTPPCGACRQVLLEFGGELPVFFAGEGGPDGPVLESTTSKLLAHAFVTFKHNEEDGSR